MSETPEMVEALMGGYWESAVWHCPPPRNRRDHPLKNASTIRLPPPFATEAAALENAAQAIQSGWAGTTIVHQGSAKPSASFYLPREAVDALGRARDRITSSTA